MSDPVEVPLNGGIANHGQVFRVGDTVRRPGKPQSQTVQSFLGHLHTVGFSEAPYPLGTDDQGREVLGWIEGYAPIEPLPRWITEDWLLLAVADVQRRLHEAARSFVPPDDAVWGTGGRYFPTEAAGDLVCHNDLCLSNVVIGANRLRGVIDFDYTHPVNPLFDIAVAARHWVPLWLPAYTTSWGDTSERGRRFRLFCDAHGLTPQQRAETVELVIAFLEQCRINLSALAADGHEAFQRLLAGGYLQHNQHSVSWVSASRAELID